MPGPTDIRIFDTTLRDGEQSPGASLNHSEKIEIARQLEAEGLSGTIRLYGTPAEEGGSGKVYMVRAGLFDDVDAALHWHPADRTSASPVYSAATRPSEIRMPRGMLRSGERTSSAIAAILVTPA